MKEDKWLNARIYAWRDNMIMIIKSDDIFTRLYEDMLEKKNSLHHMYASICFWSGKILKEVISYHNLIGLRHDYIPSLGNEKLINANIPLIVIVSQLTSERGWIILKSTSKVVNLKFIHVIVNLKFTKEKSSCHGKLEVY